MKVSPAEIEERLHNELGLDVEVEEAGDGLLVTGVVPSADDRIVALDFVRSMAEGAPVADIVDVGEGDSLSLTEPGDFTRQDVLHSPDEAAGPSGSLADEVSEGDRVYIPPIDPVGTNREILNGLAPSADESLPRRPLEGEELAGAVREALKLDSLTTGFPIEVEVEGRTVVLSGVVGDLEDASYAESIAARVPGVEAVDERLTVSAIPHRPGERRPGEAVTPSGKLPGEAVATGREALGDGPRGADREQRVEPTDEHYGGGRPYGSADATLAWDKAQPANWDDLLSWIDHAAGLAESARLGLQEDARILRDAGEPFPADGGALFDALMRAHTTEPPPPPTT